MLVTIDKIIVKDRIRKDFGNIDELAEDIRENGLINPPVVIPEQDGTFTLLAGERRLRAMKQLNYQQVEVRTWKNLSDEEKLNIEISENEVRKDFSKVEREEMYRRKVEMVRSGSNEPMEHHEAEIQAAKELGVSRTTMVRESAIVKNKNLISAEDFANWDEGKLSTNKAYQQIRAELNRQKAENERLRNQEPREVIKEVVPKDYESVKQENRQVNAEYQQLAEKWRKSESERRALLKERESSQKQEEEHIRKTALSFNAGIANFIERYGGYVWLTERVDEIPERERIGFIRGLDALEAWVSQMQNNISKEERTKAL